MKALGDLGGGLVSTLPSHEVYESSSRNVMVVRPPEVGCLKKHPFQALGWAPGIGHGVRLSLGTSQPAVSRDEIQEILNLFEYGL